MDLVDIISISIMILITGSWMYCDKQYDQWVDDNKKRKKNGKN